METVTDAPSVKVSMQSDLVPEKLLAEISTLSQRVHGRFPESGLNMVGKLLVETATQARERAEAIGRPIKSLRAAAAALLVALIGTVVWTYREFGAFLDDSVNRTIDIIVATDALASVLLVFGAGAVFLFSLGVRIRRRKALTAIHELRSIAHLIDMHQLNKDPERVLGRAELLHSSSKRKMSSFEMSRYLDYCSEMLSMTGKLGALYVQRFPDPVVVDAVAEVEQLTTGLTRKIWQKLMILYTLGRFAA